MLSGSQVQLGEDRCSVELMDDVVHGGCDNNNNNNNNNSFYLLSTLHSSRISEC